MNEVVQQCPLCGHEFNQHFDSRLFRGIKVHNRICSNCGLVFQSPRMDSDELQEFYASEYRVVYQGEEGPSPKDLLAQQGRASALLQFMMGTIPDLKCHLDIGCSAGILLEKVRDHFGNLSVGVEPGDAYRKFALAQGLNVYANLTDLEAIDSNSCDLITMAHVLEHLSDPVEYLTHLRERNLSTGGWLLIEVPNLYCHDSFEIAHLISFSAHTLSQTVQRSGFEIVKMEAHGRPRSKILPLYLTLLARPSQGTNVVRPEKGVTWKRKLGMLRRRGLQKLFPKQAWIQ